MLITFTTGKPALNFHAQHQQLNIKRYLMTEPIVTMEVIGNGFCFGMKIGDDVL